MSFDLRPHIRDVPDFPKPGIVFKDLCPLMQNAEAFAASIEALAELAAELDSRPTLIAGPEARGFVFGPALATRLRLGFVPIRKPGKLPAATRRAEYELEYGTDALEMHLDAMGPGERVLLVDDVLATGGTMGACRALVEGAEAELAGALFAIELGFLEGRRRLDGVPIGSLLIL